MGIFNRNKSKNKTYVSDGDIVIQGVSISPAPESKVVETEDEPLWRGMKFDTDLVHDRSKISLDLNGTAMVNGRKYDVQIFPQTDQPLEFLQVKSLTPWGKVTGVKFDAEARTWTVHTDKYPAGVTYRCGAGLIAANKF